MQNPSLLMSLEWPADLLIMDESSGRAMARNLNIRITGTLGVLLKAKRDGEIPSLDAEMERLVQNAGFFVSDRVRNTFLAEAGGEPMKTITSNRPTTPAQGYASKFLRSACITVLPGVHRLPISPDEKGPTT